MDLFSPRHIGLLLLDISWVNKRIIVSLLDVFDSGILRGTKLYDRYPQLEA